MLGSTISNQSWRISSWYSRHRISTLIPITLAAAVVITAVAATTLVVAMGLFAKMQPQRPSTEPGIVNQHHHNNTVRDDESDQENTDNALLNPI